jgi:ABC-type thiamine transport system substrate-binding protein
MVVLPPQNCLNTFMTNQSEQPKSSLPRDEFGRGESWHWIVFAVPAVVAALAFLLHAIRPSAGAAPRLVVYCAQDMVYAEPILREFEKRNNCTVRAVFDSEAVKTVGLANRLLAEKSNPRCDVFWGNEELRTRQLAQAGVFRADNGWAAFGYRTRRIAVNTNLLDQAEAPRSLLELTNPVWQGKVALAYPQFGTTSTHLHALRQHLGRSPWELWCRAMVQPTNRSLRKEIRPW